MPATDWPYPFWIAHRGAGKLAPENTLAAARMARHAGADMWELDVAVSADGALFVMHDDSLQRTTNAAQRFPDRAPWTFSGFTLAELEQLDYLNRLRNQRATPRGKPNMRVIC